MRLYTMPAFRAFQESIGLEKAIKNSVSALQ